MKDSPLERFMDGVYRISMALHEAGVKMPRLGLAVETKEDLFRLAQKLNWEYLQSSPRVAIQELWDEPTSKIDRSFQPIMDDKGFWYFEAKIFNIQVRVMTTDPETVQ